MPASFENSVEPRACWKNAGAEEEGTFYRRVGGQVDEGGYGRTRADGQQQ